MIQDNYNSIKMIPIHDICIPSLIVAEEPFERHNRKE